MATKKDANPLSEGAAAWNFEACRGQFEGGLALVHALVAGAKRVRTMRTKPSSRCWPGRPCRPLWQRNLQWPPWQAPPETKRVVLKVPDLFSPLHFYALNQAGLTSTIWQRLEL